MAGLWEYLNDVFGQLVWSFTPLTINASIHPLMFRYHVPIDEKRSIVILPNSSLMTWLNAANESEARSLCVPFKANQFTFSAAQEGCIYDG